MTEPRYDEQGRALPADAAGELETLQGFLDFQRATLEWKVAGLDSAGLRATTSASSMTLGGLIKHIANVEAYWFVVRLQATDWPEPWASADWAADPDWEWHSAADDTAAELTTLWRESVAASRTITADALARGGLDTLARPFGRDPSEPSLRWILVHMIEEYARHNGHADILREAVDGAVGE